MKDCFNHIARRRMCGQPRWKLPRTPHRDSFLSAAEAMEYGLIDRVVIAHPSESLRAIAPTVDRALPCPISRMAQASSTTPTPTSAF